MIRATTLQRNGALRSNATAARGRCNRVAVRLAVAVVLLSALAACTAPEDSATVNQPAATQAATASAAKPAEPPATAPGSNAPDSASSASGSAGATAALQRTMAEVLGNVVKANAKPATADITSALTTAGVQARNLEVSAGRTPTGLDVDSMEAAAVQGKECVVGQIRDGKVTVTVLPALSNGKCFVGAPA
ncbi:DUF6993 domain-containing protein [Arthrobacter sp. NPDC056727]|uniref:DUF6993 domain-containing protein n=1 Tax=Arthrobacter sp. NPDC056727 TaxID=3345927 RepID=UPI00366D4C64